MLSVQQVAGIVAKGDTSRLYSKQSLIPLPGATKQAGHTDTKENTRGDVAIMVNLSGTSRILYVWSITYQDRCVPYWDAITANGIQPSVAINQNHSMIQLDQIETYEISEGWAVHHQRIELKKGEMLLWDGHLWHAGGEVPCEDAEGEINCAWWARMHRGTPFVYAAEIHERGDSGRTEIRA